MQILYELNINQRAAEVSKYQQTTTFIDNNCLISWLLQIHDLIHFPKNVVPYNSTLLNHQNHPHHLITLAPPFSPGN